MADFPSNNLRESPASQSTRQLLDELDDLMQRMLALPVQSLDEEGRPAEVAEATPDVTPAPVAEIFPPSPPPPPGPPQELFVGLASLGRPQAPKPTPAPSIFPLRQEDVELALTAPTYLPLGAEPLLPIILEGRPTKPASPVPVAMPVKPAVAATKPHPPWQKKSETPRPVAPAMGPSWSTRLLLYVNLSFDRATAWLGGIGRWLRSEQGRTLLGWTGLAMLAVALVWAAVRFLV